MGNDSFLIGRYLMRWYSMGNDSLLMEKKVERMIFDMDWQSWRQRLPAKWRQFFRLLEVLNEDWQCQLCSLGSGGWTIQLVVLNIKTFLSNNMKLLARGRANNSTRTAYSCLRRFQGDWTIACVDKFCWPYILRRRYFNHT